MAALVAHTFVQSNDTNPVTTSAIDTTGATLLVIGYACLAASGDPTPTDSKGNTWTPALAIQADPSVVTAINMYAVVNPVVGAGHTFSSNVTGGQRPGLFVAAFSNTDTTAAADQVASAGADAATVQAGSVTPSANNELVVAVVAAHAGGVPSIDSGYAITDSAAATASVNGFGGGLAWVQQTTAAPTNPTWTSTANGFMAAAIATFKAFASPSTVLGGSL